MRKTETTIIALIGLELIVAVISYIVLPDVCATKWHFDWVEYKNKAYVLVPPLIAAIVAGISLTFSEIYMKRDTMNGLTFYHMMVFLSFTVIAVTFASVIVILVANL